MGDQPGTEAAVEKPVADPSQVAPAGAPKGVGEDPPGATDSDQEQFVLDAFTQDLFGGDEELGISQNRVAPTEEAPAPPSEVVEQPQVGAAGSQVQAEPAAPPPAQQVPEQPAPSPSGVPPQAPTPGAQPQVAAPVPPAAPAQAPVPGVAPEQMFKQLEVEVAKNREIFENALREQVYTLSEKEQEELRDNVEVAVPKLMARMHVNVVQNMLATIAQQLPGVVGGLITARTRSRDREDAFYQRWPQLNRDQHGETVRQLARSFMHMNPAADFDTAVRMIGAQALVALNLPVGTVNAPVQPQQQQQAPVRTATPGKVVRQVAAPYVPGGVQVAGAPLAANGGGSTNPFEMMDQFLVQDEQGAFDR